MKGIISDIQRFALHDGLGIRTTLFLKGCPFTVFGVSNLRPPNQYLVVGLCGFSARIVDLPGEVPLEILSGTM